MMRVSRPPEGTFSPIDQLPEPRAPATPASPVACGGPSPFIELMRGLGHELDQSEAVVARATRGGAGGGMSPDALIALQAGIYRYSEAVDLVTKLVDRATQAVKTTLQNQ